MKSLALTFIFFIAHSYFLPLFPVPWNFVFQQLYLSTWMQQSQSYQQHHLWDPRTLNGQGKHQQLRKLLSLPPVTFLKYHQRRALDTAKRKHCNCKSLDFGSVWLCVSLPNILFGGSGNLQYWRVMPGIIQADLCPTHLNRVCESVFKKKR